mgnify:CR=1 FL=1
MLKKQIEIPVEILDDTNDLIIQEKHKAIKQIEQDTKDLAETFIVLNQHVEDQSSRLDNIEEHIENVNQNTENGLFDLQQAENKENNRRKWILGLSLAGALAFSGVIVNYMTRKRN